MILNVCAETRTPHLKNSETDYTGVPHTTCLIMWYLMFNDLIIFQLNMSKLIKAPETQTSVMTPRPEGEKDLTTMIMDMETKHGNI